MAHIGGMDVWAKALIGADRLIREGDFSEYLTDRYSSWNVEPLAATLESRVVDAVDAVANNDAGLDIPNMVAGAKPNGEGEEETEEEESVTLRDLHRLTCKKGPLPEHSSGKQEMLESMLLRYV